MMSCRRVFDVTQVRYGKTRREGDEGLSGGDGGSGGPKKINNGRRWCRGGVCMCVWLFSQSTTLARFYTLEPTKKRSTFFFWFFTSLDFFAERTRRAHARDQRSSNQCRRQQNKQFKKCRFFEALNFLRNNFNFMFKMDGNNISIYLSRQTIIVLLLESCSWSLELTVKRFL